jgi:predicted metal-dependent hydrolase
LLSLTDITDDRLLIYSRSNEPEALEKHFSKWLKHQASEYMTTQTIKTARALGVEERLKEVIFRKTKTKWGHCGSDGTIQYNWLTMMAPKEVIDYLIAHESSHLVHMNHSKRFWQTVESICPDYKNLKDWLKTYGHRFWTE